ncbi:MAG: hypothetical protein COA79_11855 [Planctomycetota bacterium]|nr:MAG: hypothetical protein COA79_11855 [Planctomycetota bacterium]
MTNIAELTSMVKEFPGLPPDEGKIIHVSTIDEIILEIEEAEDHTTIIIAKGHYLMPRDILLTSHYVTIRGETGNRDDVILDFDSEFDDTNPKQSERIGAVSILKISHAKNVTIANLTVANSPKYGILFLADSKIHNLKILNIKFHNIWARGLKGTHPGRLDDQNTEFGEGYGLPCAERFEVIRPIGGEVRNCLFICDTIKKNDKDAFDGDYIAGMDMMGVKDWVIADNVFVGLRGKNGGGRGGVFIWQWSEGVTIENNIFVDCDKGVAFGNPSAMNKCDYHIKGGSIINNLFKGGTNKAIEIQYCGDIEVKDNRIISKDRTNFASIQVLDSISPVTISNNKIHKGACDEFNIDDKAIEKENEIGDFESKF